MDSIKIRELEEKSLVDSDNTMIVEDNTGTLQVPVSSLQKSLQASLYCQTVDDMKKSGFNEGDVVCTLGYHSINDGGAATYIIENNPTAVGDDMTLISLLTSDVLKARLVYDKFVSPLQCGAYGDGVHDDSEVIKALIDANIPVKFPKKTFLVSLSLDNIDLVDLIDFNGCTLKGSMSVFDQKGHGNLMLKNINFVCRGTIWIYHNYKVIIDNCTFSIDPDIEDEEYRQSEMIRFSDVDNVTISNCVFNDSGVKKQFSLITTDVGSGNINITRCVFNNTLNTIISTGCNAITVSKCIFNTVEDEMYAYRFYNIEVGATNLIVDDCYINNTEYNKQAFQVGSADMFISNTAFTNMGTFGDLENECNIIFSKLNSIHMNSPSENKYIFERVHSDANIYIRGLVFYDTYNQTREKPICPYNYYDSNRIIGKFHSPILNYSSASVMKIPIATSAMSLYMTDILANGSTVDKPMYCTTNIAIFLQFDKYGYIDNIYNAIDGQVLVIYGNTNCYLNNGRGNIDIPNTDGTYSKIYLSEIKPIILKYDLTSRKWKKIR